MAFRATRRSRPLSLRGRAASSSSRVVKSEICRLTADGLSEGRWLSLAPQVVSRRVSQVLRRSAMV